MPERWRAGWSASQWVGAWAVLTAAAWFLYMAAGVSFLDDTNYLYTVDRVAHGAHLYSDANWGVSPLTVWVALPLVWAFGAEIAFAKLVLAATAAAAILLAGRVAGQLGIGATGRVLAALAAAAYLSSGSRGPYTPLVYMLLLALFSTALEWKRRADADPDGRSARRMLVVAGVLGGCAIATKPTVGGLGVAAFLATAMLLGPRPRTDLGGRAGDALRVLAPLAAVIVLAMAPVIATGSLGDFSSQVLEKGSYVDVASISYFDGVSDLADAIVDPLADPGMLVVQTSFVLLPLSVILLAVAIPSAPRTGAIIGLFLLAAFAGVFPRADTLHVAPAMPIAVVALAWSGARLLEHQSAPRSPPSWALAGIVIVAAVLSWTQAPRQLIDHHAHVSSATHFRGALLAPGTEESIDRQADSLAEADRGEGRTMVLAPGAAVLYLVSGVANPTPYGYPLRNDMDEAGLISEIESGRIARVCLGSYTGVFAPLAPSMLIGYVKARMAPPAVPVQTTSPLACAVYRRSTP